MFGIGTVGRAFGFDMGNTVNNVTSRLFGNSIAGRGLGAITGGLTAALTGDPIGVFQQAGKLFGSITQGLGSLFKPQGGHIGGGRFPQMPGMGMPGGGMGMPGGMGTGFGPVGGLMGGTGGNSGLAAAGGALNQMGQLRNQMNAIQNSNMSPEQKQFAMMQLQQQMQMVTQMLQMISKIMQNQHNVAMAIIGNLPSR